MPPKADRIGHETTALKPATGNISGTLVIIAILAFAIIAAAAGWWYRYNATHKAARFWGPKAAKLIRDAPKVTFYYFVRDMARFDDPGLRQKLANRSLSGEVDASKARGFTHLRNALLEDQSFQWGPPPKTMPSARWILTFQDPATHEEVAIVFAYEANYCALLRDTTSPRVISCEPISSGLWGMFVELSSVPTLLPPEHR
jgi:hypothetical protein